jgi:predicted porin
VYGVEWGISLDGSGSDLSSRNRFVGLQDKNLGTLRLGRFDSPFKTAEGMVDVFNDQRYLDMDTAVGISGQGRLSNVIGYTSPVLADVLTVQVALQQGEGADGHGLGDGVAASAAYNQNNLYMALALEKDIQDGQASYAGAGGGFFGMPASYPTSGVHGTGADSRDGLRAVVVYTMNELQLGALLQSTQATNEDIGGAGANKADETALLVSAAYKMGKNTFKGELGYNKVDFGAGDAKGTFLGLGMDHNFTANTKVYGQAGYQQISSTPDINNSVVGVGMETKF